MRCCSGCLRICPAWSGPRFWEGPVPMRPTAFSSPRMEKLWCAGGPRRPISLCLPMATTPPSGGVPTGLRCAFPRTVALRQAGRCLAPANTTRPTLSNSTPLVRCTCLAKAQETNPSPWERTQTVHWQGNLWHVCLPGWTIWCGTRGWETPPIPGALTSAQRPSSSAIAGRSTSADGGATATTAVHSFPRRAPKACPSQMGHSKRTPPAEIFGSG